MRMDMLPRPTEWLGVVLPLQASPPTKPSLLCILQTLLVPSLFHYESEVVRQLNWAFAMQQVFLCTNLT